MRKNKQETIEYIPEWDGGSYQTGAAKPPKRSNTLVAVLLVVVIFLGGLASAMGVLNVQLLMKMSQQGDSVNPLDTNAVPHDTVSNAFLGNHDAPVPTVPEPYPLELITFSMLDSMTSDQIFGHNEQAMVSVYCTTHGSETVSGTGVVISTNGYIITNAHILEAAQRVFVYLSDGQLLRAAIVGSDPFTDLAVLYVESERLKPALFTKTASLQTNEQIHAMKGQPDADRNFLISGNFEGFEQMSTGDLSVRVMHSSLWGDSGPIFDNNGQILAIQTGKIGRYFEKNHSDVKGIAIPTEVVEKVAQALIMNGHIEGRPMLGLQVEVISKLYQHYWALPGGLLVTQINKGSNASFQGLKDGDILLTLDGVELSTRADLYATLYRAQIGDELIAAVFRDGRKFTVTLTVEEIENTD